MSADTEHPIWIGRHSTDAELDPSLDFEPHCAVNVLNTLTKEITDECPNPAAWIGIPPCGHEDYFCEQHRHDERMYTCMACRRRNMHLSHYKWIPL